MIEDKGDHLVYRSPYQKISPKAKLAFDLTQHLIFSGRCDDLTVSQMREQYLNPLFDKETLEEMDKHLKSIGYM
jgi:hypothetical protein